MAIVPDTSDIPHRDVGNSPGLCKLLFPFTKPTDVAGGLCPRPCRRPDKGGGYAPAVKTMNGY